MGSRSITTPNNDWARVYGAKPVPMRRIATLQTEYVDGTSLKYNNHSD